MQPRLMVIGHADHGKDTCCALLGELFNITSISSSYFANEKIIYPLLKDRYPTPQACYEDRDNNRPFWFTKIKDYNTPDGCRLARDLYQAYDAYNGCRNRIEFQAIKEAKLFDYALWVDASLRKPPEDSRSCTVTPQDADYILDNNGPLSSTKQQLKELILHLYPHLRTPHV